MLRLLEHPNILSLYEAIIQTEYLFMVMPLCDEDLNSFLRREGPRRQPSRFFRVMRQQAAGLTECHRQRIDNGDIKPANILRRRCRFLLADFGLAEKLTTGQPLLTEPAGTIVYWAPEQRNRMTRPSTCERWGWWPKRWRPADRAVRERTSNIIGPHPWAKDTGRRWND
ncbi:cell division protein kinase 2 homolog [Coccinella septempunctata]|uniref:cell division protein kinase 2 homolog n=1 Tax=Coccinella septempunctata TaxID=41139 RepID=UPI001D099363|nr:cell division protein kinase 2 homolog [Coccinella septempunctata]